MSADMFVFIVIIFKYNSLKRDKIMFDLLENNRDNYTMEIAENDG